MATFAGGDANEFAKSLAESTHQSVVVSQSVLEPIKPVQYNPDDLTEMARTLRAKTGLAIAPGSRLTLSDGMIDPSRLSQWARVKEPIWMELKEGLVKDGKVSLETTGQERLDPASLEKVKFSRPLKVHWFLAHIPVSAWVHDMPEEEFLTYVAKSVGAQLFVSNKEYRLDLDPAQLRERTIKRIDNWSDKWFVLNEDVDNAKRVRDRFSFLKAALSAAGPGNIADAFKTPESSTQYSVLRSSGAVKTFIDLLNPMMKQDDQGFAGVQTPAGFLRLTDMLSGEKPLDITLGAKFTVKVGCRFDVDGKPGNLAFEFMDG